MRPALLPHEETLVMWWRSGIRSNTFDQWMNISHRCSGASAACADFRNAAHAAADFSTASWLAIDLAFAAPLMEVSSRSTVASWPPRVSKGGAA